MKTPHHTLACHVFAPRLDQDEGRRMVSDHERPLDHGPRSGHHKREDGDDRQEVSNPEPGPVDYHPERQVPANPAKTDDARSEQRDQRARKFVSDPPDDDKIAVCDVEATDVTHL